jgi:hypothetical protein
MCLLLVACGICGSFQDQRPGLAFWQAAEKALGRSLSD